MIKAMTLKHRISKNALRLLSVAMSMGGGGEKGL